MHISCIERCRFKYLISFLVIIILITSTFCTSAVADEEQVLYGKITTNLKIREMPTTDSIQVGLLYKDEIVEILGVVDDWYRVKGGFVYSSYVTIIDNSALKFMEAESTYSILDMTQDNMPYLRNKYIGTLSKKTKGEGVTNNKKLNFVGDIPIIDIIDGYAYFASGKDIYKAKVSSFETIVEIGDDCEIIDAYRTVFFSSTKNRKYNIALVASIIDGKVIKSGYSFSYNKTTGPRGEAEGYKLATVILNGEYTEDFGGGICQVSSTIYAAVKNDRAIQILSRHAHALEVSYLPIGMDATVSYGGTDFKFRNNHPFSIVINAKVENDAILITISKKK